MTRRRKLILVLLAVATVLILLATNIHWRVYGWARGEPFFQRLPASYYASRVRSTFSAVTELGALPRVSAH